jgi:hypothetical protein
MTVMEESTFTTHPLPETNPQPHCPNLFVPLPPVPAFKAPLTPQSRVEPTKSPSLRVLPSTPTSPTKKGNRSHLPLFSPSPRRILPSSPAMVLQTVLEDGSPLEPISRGGLSLELGSEDPFLATGHSHASLAHIPSPVSCSPRSSSVTPRPATVLNRLLTCSLKYSSPSPTRSSVRAGLDREDVMSPMTRQVEEKLNVQQDMPLSTSSLNTTANQWRSARLAYEARKWRNMVGSQVRSVGRFREKISGKKSDGERGRSLWRRGDDGKGLGGKGDADWI